MIKESAVTLDTQPYPPYINIKREGDFVRITVRGEARMVTFGHNNPVPDAGHTAVIHLTNAQFEELINGL